VSASTVDKLIIEANHAARFFVSQPHEIAALKTADHINAFWDGRMKRLMLEHVANGGGGVDPVVLEALRLVKATPHERIEAALEAAGEPSTGHSPGDDAG
jgi:formate dehydrogenase subunit delta